MKVDTFFEEHGKNLPFRGQDDVFKSWEHSGISDTILLKKLSSCTCLNNNTSGALCICPLYATKVTCVWAERENGKKAMGGESVAVRLNSKTKRDEASHPCKLINALMFGRNDASCRLGAGAYSPASRNQHECEYESKIEMMIEEFPWRAYPMQVARNRPAQSVALCGGRFAQQGLPNHLLEEWTNRKE
jgi:hypothetical protein